MNELTKDDPLWAHDAIKDIDERRDAVNSLIAKLSSEMAEAHARLSKLNEARDAVFVALGGLL